MVTILNSSECCPFDDNAPQPDTFMRSPFWNVIPGSGRVTGAALEIKNSKI